MLFKKDISNSKGYKQLSKTRVGKGCLRIRQISKDSRSVCSIIQRLNSRKVCVCVCVCARAHVSMCATEWKRTENMNTLRPKRRNTSHNEIWISSVSTDRTITNSPGPVQICGSVSLLSFTVRVLGQHTYVAT